jgi:hypothetical protein
LLFRVPGTQLRLISAAGTAGGVSVKFADCVPPFKDAVMVTVSFEGTPVTDAANCALLCPENTVTEPGTVTLALLSERLTVVFEVAAAAKDTVQVALPAVVKLVGAQVKIESPAGATRLSGAVRVTPLSATVTVAVWLEPMVPADAVNEPLEPPLAMARVEGVVNDPLLFETLRVEVPVEALSRVAVQVAD